MASRIVVEAVAMQSSIFLASASDIMDILGRSSLLRREKKMYLLATIAGLSNPFVSLLVPF